jgi:hypothetical protein
VELYQRYTIDCNSPHANVGRFSSAEERLAVMRSINAEIPFGTRVFQAFVQLPVTLTYQDGSYEAFVPGVSANEPSPVPDSFRVPAILNPPCVG